MEAKPRKWNSTRLLLCKALLWATGTIMFWGLVVLEIFLTALKISFTTTLEGLILTPPQVEWLVVLKLKFKAHRSQSVRSTIPQETRITWLRLYPLLWTNNILWQTQSLDNRSLQAKRRLSLYHPEEASQYLQESSSIELNVLLVKIVIEIEVLICL